MSYIWFDKQNHWGVSGKLQKKNIEKKSIAPGEGNSQSHKWEYKDMPTVG